MPVQPPSLDDRSFEDLVAEMLARIPAHTPEYTFPQVGDPGHTLIDLFAWLADTVLYRANLIPERQRLAFLRLLGIQMRPAVAASTVVTVNNKDARLDARYIAAQARLKGPVNFETTTPLVVLPVSAEAYYKRPLDEDEEGRMSELLEGLRGWYEERAFVEDANQLGFYVTTPVFAGGSPLPYGLDLVNGTMDGCLWVALMAEEPAQVEALREALGEGVAGGQQVINIGMMPAVEVPDWDEDIGPKARLEHIWEISGLSSADGSPIYTPLDRILDTTDELTKRGIQRLLLPRDDFIGKPANDIRTDVDAGVGAMAPPRMDDPEKDSRIIAWLRLRPAANLAEMRLSWVGINAVPIDQYETTNYRVLGQSNGAADQVFQLPATSVEAQSLVIEVEEPGRGYQAWQQIADMELAGRDSRAYVLDSEAGTVKLGYGMKGVIPGVGMRVRVANMRAGGGYAGNLPPMTLTKIDAKGLDGATVGGLEVFQPIATDGGQDAESLANAEKRIPGLLRTQNRAILADDYSFYAYQTPGRTVGRVEVLPKFRPHPPRDNMAGVISVMVLPGKPGYLSPYPRADKPLLEAVYAQLDARRPLATELYVIGCEYVPMGASVAIEIREGYTREEVLDAVRQTLRAYMWPLVPGGINGTGWPLGESVVDRDIELVVARVPGVARLLGSRVNLFEWNSETEKLDPLPRASSSASVEIALKKWQLPELIGLSVVADSEPQTDLTDVTVPYFAGDGRNLMPIPVVPEVCR